jgi:hypothetical protein
VPETVSGWPYWPVPSLPKTNSPEPSAFTVAEPVESSTSTKVYPADGVIRPDGLPCPDRSFFWYVPGPV